MFDIRAAINLVEAIDAPDHPLFHTTSPGSAMAILQDREIRPRNVEGFVSLSETPLANGDIREDGCTLVFSTAAFGAQVVAVDYSEAWFEAHPAIGAYIAGEGWIEQYFEPEDAYDDGWGDDDALEADRHAAEVEAFLVKSDEHEHVSLRPGVAVRFDPGAVLAVMVHDGLLDDWREDLDRLGYSHVRIVPSQHW